MKNIILISILVLTTNLFGQKAIYTDNDGDGIIEYTLTDNTGKIQETGYYYSGKMVGTWISYYPNGKKMMVAKFKSGVKHGTWSVFDNKGRLINEIIYKDNKKISASQHSYSVN